MSMSVQNNLMALQARNVLTKNEKSKDRAAAHLSAGEKITTAGEGASEYAISEKMKVMLRSLGQDEQNVQTGATLLHVAEGGVQNQIELMKAIKAKVLDANNDTNTDIDRATIQKEIDQRYAEIDDISVETSYNDKLVLHGNHVKETVRSWVTLDAPVEIEDSDALNLIPNKYDSLNGKTGPFDVFSAYTTTIVAIDALGITTAGVPMTGGTDGTAAKWSVDLNNEVYNTTDPLTTQLEGKGISITANGSTYKYVLTADSSKTYKNMYAAIDISGCSTLSDAAAKIASSVSYPAKIAASGTVLTFTSNATGAGLTSSNCSTQGWSQAAETGSSVLVTPAQSAVAARAASAATGRISGTKYFSGGTDSHGISGDADNPYVAATAASLTIDMSAAAVDSGFTLEGSYYVKFVAGSSESYDSSTGVYSVGKDYKGTFSIDSARLTMDSGIMTLTASSAGTWGNSLFVADGISARAAQAATDAVYKTVDYAAVTPLGGLENTWIQNGTDGTKASHTFDLGAYSTTDADKLETFISDLAGKAISYPALYEFVDSAAASLDSVQEIYGSSTIDLNSLRSSVAGGTTIAAAFANLMVSRLGASYAETVSTDGTVTGLTLKAAYAGSVYNNYSGTTIYAEEGSPRSYTINFTNWLNQADTQTAVNAAGGLAQYLDYKGFRAYCATCADQWFNFEFINGLESVDGKPKSGTDDADIKTLLVDVSKVTDAASLVQAMYDQIKPLLTGADPDYNHYMRAAADTAAGTFTLYDNRLYDVSSYPHYQAPGPKIADGILDNVVRQDRKVEVERLYIQHTDKASKNILIDIPKTSLDHIFAFIPTSSAWKQYTVMTRVNRENLLGKPPADGILDKGIQYLTDANTLIGAQINHLSHAQDNIVTQQENVTAAESTIRDTDMAAAMTTYAKENILAQSAQAMLAQANSDTSSVLKLIQ